MSKEQFLKGTLILTCTGLLCRLAGFFYRIFLSHTIGAQGVGIYQLSLPLSALLLFYSFDVLASPLFPALPPISCLYRRVFPCSCPFTLSQMVSYGRAQCAGKGNRPTRVGRDHGPHDSRGEDLEGIERRRLCHNPSKSRLSASARTSRRSATSRS